MRYRQINQSYNRRTTFSGSGGFFVAARSTFPRMTSQKPRLWIVSVLPTAREFELFFCSRPEGHSRGLNLVMIDATDGEVFHHTATAAMLENLPQIAPLATP
jgi:hypothetical protein